MTSPDTHEVTCYRSALMEPEFGADIGQPQLGMLGIETKENINCYLMGYRGEANAPHRSGGAIEQTKWRWSYPETDRTSPEIKPLKSWVQGPGDIAFFLPGKFTIPAVSPTTARSWFV